MCRNKKKNPFKGKFERVCPFCNVGDMGVYNFDDKKWEIPFKCKKCGGELFDWTTV